MWLLGFELWTFGRAVGCSYPLSHLTSPPPSFYDFSFGQAVVVVVVVVLVVAEGGGSL